MQVQPGTGVRRFRWKHLRCPAQSLSRVHHPWQTEQVPVPAVPLQPFISGVTFVRVWAFATERNTAAAARRADIERNFPNLIFVQMLFDAKAGVLLNLWDKNTQTLKIAHPFSSSNVCLL